MLIYNIPEIYELGFKWIPLSVSRDIWTQKVLKSAREISFPVKNIIDVCTGTGFLMPFIRRLFPKAKIIGVDKSKKMIEFARKHYSMYAEFKVNDFWNIEGKYDLVLITGGFYYFPLKPGIEKLNSLLATPGKAIITHCSKSPYTIMHSIFSLITTGTRTHLHSTSCFKKELERKGLIVNTKLVNPIEGTYIVTSVRC
jgi:ubiquinone/menaquinone biosynthesis C-methylase UbiE